MNKQSKILATILAAFAVVAMAYWIGSPRQFSATAAVKVAANLPLSGPLATYGTAVREGVTLALEKTQSDGSLGLMFDWQDNASDPKNAVTIMQRQFLQNPTVYISGVKPQTMAITSQVTERGLPHFVWIFDPVINHNSKNNFRTWVSYKIEPPIYLSYVAKRAAKRISIIYVQLPHTIEEFEKLVVPGLKKNGISEIQVQVYDFGRSDFKDIAAKVKEFGPDLLILNGFQTELVGMIRALRPLSLISDGNTIATYDMMDAAKVLGADELEGIRVVAPLFETRPQAEPVAAWIKQFTARFNKQPLYTNAFGYDMAMILKDVGRRVGLSATSADWINAIRATNISGITGSLKFDSDGDIITPLEVGVYRAGKLVPDTQAR